MWTVCKSRSDESIADMEDVITSVLHAGVSSRRMQQRVEHKRLFFFLSLPLLSSFFHCVRFCEWELAQPSSEVPFSTHHPCARMRLSTLSVTNMLRLWCTVNSQCYRENRRWCFVIKHFRRRWLWPHQEAVMKEKRNYILFWNFFAPFFLLLLQFCHCR